MNKEHNIVLNFATIYRKVDAIVTLVTSTDLLIFQKGGRKIIL